MHLIKTRKPICFSCGENTVIISTTIGGDHAITHTCKDNFYDRIAGPFVSLESAIEALEDLKQGRGDHHLRPYLR